MDYISALEYTVSVTGPVFIIVFVGFYLKRKDVIDQNFITKASGLVFNVCLPILIFLSMLDNDLDMSQQVPLVIFCISAAVASFVIFWLLSKYWVDHQDRGVVVQGAFRSNLGIIGIALCAKAFDQDGLAIGAIILAVVTPVYNILSVYALNRSVDSNRAVNWQKTFIDILKNPLIIAIFLGFLANWLDLKLPKVMYDASHYLARMTLPLALIAIGGALSIQELKNTSVLSFWAVAGKLVIVPIFAGLSAYTLGFEGAALGCIILMFASPTAAASFVMVRSMGGNDRLASNIIAVSTLLSVFSVSFLLYFTKVLAWI
ncbi:AEC family transporter [Oceaniserpentilla sp. 4NH20-0058]|uniref:AEC family transporter n=1 Tax=Oceaniserpentilla sp. 4NH20-0058 TaxID=3127660 RepID=UPI0031085AF2